MLGIETDYKTYEMLRLPFGLSVSPMAYQRIMNKITADSLYRFCVSYIDDLLTYSQSFPDHLHHLRLVLQRLSDAGLRMRADKCIWAQHKLPYLGFILSGDGIEPDPKKLTLISQAQPPKNAKMLKSFLGLTSFYRRFIRRYAALTEPFRCLLRKGAKFVWTDAHQTAFDRLKTIMTSSPVVLAYPDWDKEFVLITDAAKTGSGFIISQRDANDRLRVICYGGRQWNKHEQEMSASEMELASILYAIESNSQFFLSKRFTILTDHVSHCYVRNLKFQHGKLYRWALRLQNYVFDIKHIRGKLTPADYISRAVEYNDPTANDLDDDSALVRVIDSGRTDRWTDDSLQQQWVMPSSVTQSVVAPAMRHPKRRGCRKFVAIDTPRELLEIFSLHHVDRDQSCQDRTTSSITSESVTHPENTGRAVIEHTSLRVCEHSIPDPVATVRVGPTAAYRPPVTVDPHPTRDSLVISDLSQTALNTVNDDSYDRKVLSSLSHDELPTITQTDPLVTKQDPNADSVGSQSLQIYLHKQLASDFATHQRQCSDLKPIFQFLESGTIPVDRKLAANLRDNIYQVDDTGILYRIYQPLKRNVNSVRPSVKQLLIPTHMRQDLLSLAHDSMSHFRLEKMYQTLQQTVYWPGLYRDIQYFLRKCERCAKASQRPPLEVVCYNTQRSLNHLRLWLWTTCQCRRPSTHLQDSQ